MMADFAAAVEFVLQNEGGYINDPQDPGGETNFGISRRQYPLLDIKNLTRQEAIAIYERDYWEFGELASQRLATKMLDIYVNLPPSHAIRLLQLALRPMTAKSILADGSLGPETIAAANEACVFDETGLLEQLKFQLVRYYCQELRTNPAQERFLDGHLLRAVKG